MRVDAGTVLGNRYQLTVPIASGGMGEVWEAHDELLGRTVAVKVLRSELATDHGFLARFRTEARNSARLAHPSIAATYDYGESDGSAWLVMELVPGEPLSDLLATQHSVEPRRAMQIIASAASGLAAAHEAGIVHRDVKPGNLLVTPTGGVKVTDFGIARAAAEAPLTATGQVMGTAAYLSPEQATGRRDLTPAVDVYALGVVAHEMLAGQRPFTGESQVAIALAQVNDPPPPLPASVPRGARALVDACLAKDPHARPRDAAVVAHVASLVAEGDDSRAEQVLRAGLGTAGAAAAGATVAMPSGVPTTDATRVVPPFGAAAARSEDTVPWPEPAASPTRRSAQAAAAYGAGSQLGHDGYGDQTGRAAGDPEPTGQRRGRSRMTVPLIGLLAVLLVVLVALVAGALGQADDPVEPPTQLSSATEQAPSASTGATTTVPRESESASTPSATTPSATETTPADTETTPTDPSSAPSATADDPASSAAPSSPAATSAAPTTPAAGAAGAAGAAAGAGGA